MKFIQIKSHNDSLHWALLLDNMQDFEKFLEDKASDLTTAYNEAKESTKRYGYVSHVGPVAYAIGMELSKHDNRNTVVDDIMIYTQTFLKSFIDVFYKEGKIIVWQNVSSWQNQKYGGFMPYSAFNNHPMKLEIIKTIERDELIFPSDKTKLKYTEKDISINKWEGGRHFYAKIGNKDVSIEGKMKWNTHKMAMDSAKKFMNELNKEE